SWLATPPPAPVIAVMTPRRTKAPAPAVEVQDGLLPRPVVLQRLWDRVFNAADAEAHAQAFSLLETGYTAALAAELKRRPDADLPALVRCLRQAPQARRYFPSLLRSRDGRVR